MKIDSFYRPVYRFRFLLRLLTTLAFLWLLLSGIFKPLLLILGVISIAIVAYFAVKMRVLEHRGQPIYFRPFHIVRYWCWLLIEILKSNWDVTLRVFHPSLPIKPLLKAIPATQKTEIGRVIYANSITLTPGTVAINIAHNGDILVHALHEDSIKELEDGYMSKKVSQLEPDFASIESSVENKGKLS